MFIDARDLHRLHCGLYYPVFNKILFALAHVERSNRRHVGIVMDFRFASLRGQLDGWQRKGHPFNFA